MQTKQQTSKEYFNTLAIIHAALIIGQLLFACVAFYVNSKGETADESELNDLLLLAAPILAFSGIIGSSFLTKTRLKLIKEKTSLKEKLSEYQTTLIISFALLEGPSIFSLVCYLLTANYIFLAIAGLIIVIFFVIKPTRQKTIKDLALNHQERDLIEDPKAIII